MHTPIVIGQALIVSALTVAGCVSTSTTRSASSASAKLTTYDVLNIFVTKGAAAFRDGCARVNGNLTSQGGGLHSCDVRTSTYGVLERNGHVLSAAYITSDDMTEIIADELTDRLGADGWYKTDDTGVRKALASGRTVTFRAESGLVAVKVTRTSEATHTTATARARSSASPSRLAQRSSRSSNVAASMNAATRHLSNSLQQNYQQQQNAPATQSNCRPNGFGGVVCDHSNDHGVSKGTTQCVPDGLGGMRCSTTAY